MGFLPRFLHPPGDVAQLVEHLLCKQGVGGSSPLVSTLADPVILGPLVAEDRRSEHHAAAACRLRRGHDAEHGAKEGRSQVG